MHKKQRYKWKKIDKEISKERKERKEKKEIDK